MSLEIDMKLQDLLEKENKLWEPRIAVLKDQRSKAADEIKKSIVSFFEEKDFTVSGVGTKLKAIYKSGVEIEIDTKDLETPHIGSDGLCSVKYKGREILISYMVNTGNLPQELMSSGRSKEELDMKKIQFYEDTYLPALENIGISDLDGSYKLFSTVAISGKNERKAHKSIDDLLTDFFN